MKTIQTQIQLGTTKLSKSKLRALRGAWWFKQIRQVVSDTKAYNYEQMQQWEPRSGLPKKVEDQ